jgi:hypothetical protein
MSDEDIKFQAEGRKPRPKNGDPLTIDTEAQDADLRWHHLVQEAHIAGESVADYEAHCRRVSPGESVTLGKISGSAIEGSVVPGVGESPGEAFQRVFVDTFHIDYPTRATYEVDFRRRSDAAYCKRGKLSLEAGPIVAAQRARARGIVEQHNQRVNASGVGAPMPQASMYGYGNPGAAVPDAAAALRKEFDDKLAAALGPMVKAIELLTQKVVGAGAPPPPKPLTAEDIAAAVTAAQRTAQSEEEKTARIVGAALKAAGIQPGQAQAPAPAVVAPQVGVGAAPEAPSKPLTVGQAIRAAKHQFLDAKAALDDMSEALGVGGAPAVDEGAKAEIVPRKKWVHEPIGAGGQFSRPVYQQRVDPETGETDEEDKPKWTAYAREWFLGNPVIQDKVVNGGIGAVSRMAGAVRVLAEAGARKLGVDPSKLTEVLEAEETGTGQPQANGTNEDAPRWTRPA